jgi:hypothetical protein
MTGSCHRIFTTEFPGNRGEFVFHPPSFSAAVVNAASITTMKSRPMRLNTDSTSQKFGIRFIAGESGSGWWRRTIINRSHIVQKKHSLLPGIHQQANPPIYRR